MPVRDVWFLVSLEDENLATEWTQRNEAAVGAPGETLDSREDPVGNGGLFLRFREHIV